MMDICNRVDEACDQFKMKDPFVCLVAKPGVGNDPVKLRELFFNAHKYGYEIYETVKSDLPPWTLYCFYLAEPGPTVYEVPETPKKKRTKRGGA